MQDFIPEAIAYQNILDSVQEPTMISVHQLRSNLELSNKEKIRNRNFSRGRITERNESNLQSPKLLIDRRLVQEGKIPVHSGRMRVIYSHNASKHGSSSPVRPCLQFIRKAGHANTTQKSFLNRKGSGVSNSHSTMKPLVASSTKSSTKLESNTQNSYDWLRNRKVSHPEVFIPSSENIHTGERKGGRTAAISPRETPFKYVHCMQKKRFEDLSDKFDIIVNFLNHPIQQMPVQESQTNQNYVPLNQYRRAHNLLTDKTASIPENQKTFEDHEYDLIKKREIQQKHKLITKLLEEYKPTLLEQRNTQPVVKVCESGSDAKYGQGRKLKESKKATSTTKNIYSHTHTHKNMVSVSGTSMKRKGDDILVNKQFSNLIKGQKQKNVVIEIPKSREMRDHGITSMQTLELTNTMSKINIEKKIDSPIASAADCKYAAYSKHNKSKVDNKDKGERENKCKCKSKCKCQCKCHCKCKSESNWKCESNCKCKCKYKSNLKNNELEKNYERYVGQLEKDKFPPLSLKNFFPKAQPNIKSLVADADGREDDPELFDLYTALSELVADDKKL